MEKIGENSTNGKQPLEVLAEWLYRYKSNRDNWLRINEEYPDLADSYRRDAKLLLEKLEPPSGIYLSQKSAKVALSAVRHLELGVRAWASLPDEAEARRTHETILGVIIELQSGIKAGT